MYRFRYKLEEDGTVFTPGVGWVKPLVNILTLDRYALWKAPGGTAWAGRFSTAYYPTEYMVMRLEEGRAFRLLSVEPGRKWKVIRDILQGMVMCLEGVKHEQG